MEKIDVIILSPEATLLEALEAIDLGVRGIALIVEDNNELIGTITDGDIRRALIKKASLDDKVSNFMAIAPIKAKEGTTNYELMSIMKSKGIDQIPIVNDQGTLVDIKSLTELIKGVEKDNHLVIMAGGLGLRLRPLTEGTPKPLLPIGHKPILETILEHAKAYGLTNITMTINYLSESIKSYFGDGSSFGLNISYIEETEGRGTAGSICLLKEKIDKDLFVINGDILTRVNFDEMLQKHLGNKNFLTVGIRPYKTQIPYGIIKEHEETILGVEEKPVLEYKINAGIYILSPSILDYIPEKSCFHMTDLMEKLITDNLRVGSFMINEYWLDIGKINDYYKANFEFSEFFM